MDKQNNEEIKKQAAYWRKKLNYYLYESHGDYDVEELLAIIETVKILDPKEPGEEYFTPEQSLERFWKSYQLRQEIYEEFEKLKRGEVSVADYPDDFPEDCEEALMEASYAKADAPTEVVEQKPDQKKIKKFNTTRITKWVTAAALVVAVFLGGTVGAYAEKEGFFHKISAGKDKNTVVTSPDDVENENMEHKVFDSMEEVPVKYVGCIWTPINIPQELKLNIIELSEDKHKVKIMCEFADKEQFLHTTKTSFKDVVIVNDQLYDGFDFYRKLVYDSVEVEYFIKENEDYTEYIALFEYENSIYSLNSNLSFETMELIIEESIQDKNL